MMHSKRDMQHLVFLVSCALLYPSPACRCPVLLPLCRSSVPLLCFSLRICNA